MKTKNFPLTLIAAILILTSAAAAQDIKTGLVLWHSYEYDALDASGSGYHGLVAGDAKYAKGRFGAAIDLDGETNYVELPKENSPDLISGAGFSWAVWFKPDALPTGALDGFAATLIAVADERPSEDVVLGFGSYVGAKEDFLFEVDGAGGFGATMDPPIIYEPPGGFQTDEWYFVVGIRDYSDNKAKLYFNGELIESKPWGEAEITRQMYAAIGAFIDGREVDGQPLIEGFFDGLIDEVKIYNRALADADVMALYELNPDQLEVDVDSLDFGSLMCKNDSLTTITLKNNGPDNFEITDVSFSSGLNFTSSGGAFTLADQEEKVLQIQFVPSGVGEFRDTLIILNDSGLPPLKIPAIGRKDRLEYAFSHSGGQPLEDGEEIDFGYVCPGEVVDTIIYIEMTSSLQAFFDGEIDLPFELVGDSIGAQSTPLDSNEKRGVAIRFASGAKDSVYESSLKIIDVCGVETEITLKGETYSPEFVAEVPPDTLICPNSQYDIVIKIENKKKRDLALDFSSTNNRFLTPASATIDPNSTGDITITYTGADFGVISETYVTASADCAVDTTFLVRIQVSDIRVKSSADTLDFGELVLCVADTSVAQSFEITNENVSDRAVSVISAEIGGEGASAFSTNLSEGASFEMGAPANFDLVFAPDAPGLYKAALTIVYDTCDVADIIELEALATELIYDYSQPLNFGFVLKDEIVDTVVYFANTGTTNLSVESLEPLAQPFSIIDVQPATPAKLAPGDTLKATIRFEAFGGFWRDALVYNIKTPCGDFEHETPLEGKGSFQAFATVEIPDLSAKPGDIISIPVYIKDTVDIELAELTGFSAELNVNATVLIPFGSTPKGTLDGERLIVPIELPAKPAGEIEILKEFEFKAVLGNSELDSVYIQNVSPEGGVAEISTDAGGFTLTDLCKADGTRLFDALGELALYRSKPNPASQTVEIEYELIEEGYCELVLTNASGEKVKTVFAEWKKPGAYVAKFDLSGLAPGMYIYALKTPNSVVARTMRVVR